MTQVVFNRDALDRLFGPQGPIGRDLERRAINVENQAKINASGRPGPKIRSGRLRSSITHEITADSAGLTAKVGTNVEYGYYLETGLRNGVTYPFLVPALQAAVI